MLTLSGLRFLLLLGTLLVQSWISTSDDVTRSITVSGDYCPWSTFAPSCANNEIIFMTHALYGRMRLGTCIKEDHGNTGCSQDVLPAADLKCSGRKSCSVHIPDPQFEQTHPCGELQNYLEASFICNAVISMNTVSCDVCSVMKIVEPSSGYLSSLTTQETGCGGSDCPWLIEAPPGQYIRLTLFDFSYSENQNLTGICRVCAVIKETSIRKSETVCGSHQRERLVYESAGNMVEVRINTHADRYFALHYEFAGCADLSVPGMKFTRDGSVATLECEGDCEQTTLICNGTTWFGTTPNCTGHDSSSSKLDELFAPAFSTTTAILVIVGIAVVIGACILVIGILYLKRRHHQAPQTSAGRGVTETGQTQPVYDVYGAGPSDVTRHDAVLSPPYPQQAFRPLPPRIEINPKQRIYEDIHSDYTHMWDHTFPQKRWLDPRDV